MDSNTSSDFSLDPPDPPADEVLHTLIAGEMGEPIAELLRQSRRAQEAWRRRQNPDEGLRERKVRLTRQLISDAATTLFVTRGFDQVKVSEVAEHVGVSLKTIYNYFPTKEAMVLDGADESVETLAGALRKRRPVESITDAVVRSVKADMDRYDQVPEALVDFVPRFLRMIEDTPALRASWLNLHDRLARVARDEIAAAAGVDPHDPEPTVAGRALASLPEVAIHSQVRHIEAGLRGETLRQAVTSDLDRAARLLETGLWSFQLPHSAHAASQVQEATRSAEKARAQVLKALQDARAAKNEVSQQGNTAAEDARDGARKAKEAARETKEVARRLRSSIR